MKLRDRPGYGWVVLGTFTLNYSVIIIGIMTLGLLLPDISEELSLSPSQQAWLASSVLFGNVIFEIPVTWWFSRYRPWRVASISFITAALFFVLNGWAPTFAALIIARVGLGLVYLTTRPPRTLVIIQWIPSKYTGLANGVLFGIIMFLFGVGYIVVPLILVWVGSWRNTLYTWAGLCLVVSLVWVFIGRDRAPPRSRPMERSQEKTPLGSLLKYKELWIMGLGMAGSECARMGFSTFWPTFTGEEYDIDVTVAGVVIGIMSLAGAPSILGITILPFFARHTPAAMIVGGILSSASYIGLLYTGSLPLLIIFGVLNGASFAFFPLVMTALYRLPGIRPREVAVVVSAMYTLMWAGSAAGPLIAGFVQEATGDLRLGLFITCLGPLSIAAAGIVLAGRVRGVRQPALAGTPESG